ncbi:unnamed protein product [Diatraea saccharalis]|uniref:Ubiquitin-like modifier-activating enzyme ATG7 n=1 Tax=Diatraea saccharalis TaxID=40085 RepID=A0A9P0C9N7_9NEOP|nr:unnamed protein product [Diatraea saccharalis]
MPYNHNILCKTSSTPEDEMFYQNLTGRLLNKNTIEDFKNIDKASLLNTVGEALWKDLKSGSWITNPSCLLNFIVLSFADLKKFHYYYWFAFPAPSQPTIYLCEKSKSISNHFNKEQLVKLAQGFKSLDIQQRCFFVVRKNSIDTGICVDILSKVLQRKDMSQWELDLDITNTYFAFLDSSNGNNPGWSLRLFLAVLFDFYPNLHKNNLQIIGLRCSVNGGIENSLIFTTKSSQSLQTVDSAGWVGWERNDKGNFGPKLANMSASMDPIKLAATASDLNIKLMKWRLVPDINVDVMKATKCLLLGAGTLGCHVARNLLAWGFRHITFIDNGKVSYSNPTRQVLFNYQDSLGGGRKKAEAAADNLKLILPTVNSQGIVAHIPMPGHPVGESLKDETIKNIKLITDSIKEHDVVFLLLDTREARWLPTLIASYYGKITINAALGFDSYLVMRHGISNSTVIGETSHENVFISGEQLGCYFCNDVTAPGNSSKDRTLDQQCTVTRPGASAVAGALAVELLVAMLQHPKAVDAPAIYNLSSDTANDLPPDMQGVLGPIPHSIRGFLHSFQSVLPTCAKFKQCIACSDIVINKYKEERTEFLLKVFNSGTYLEDVTGLSELHLAAEMTDMLALSDDDDE